MIPLSGLDIAMSAWCVLVAEGGGTPRAWHDLFAPWRLCECCFCTSEVVVW